MEDSATEGSRGFAPFPDEVLGKIVEFADFRAVRSLLLVNKLWTGAVKHVYNRRLSSEAGAAPLHVCDPNKLYKLYCSADHTPHPLEFLAQGPFRETDVIVDHLIGLHRSKMKERGLERFLKPLRRRELEQDIRKVVSRLAVRSDPEQDGAPVLVAPIGTGNKSGTRRARRERTLNARRARRRSPFDKVDIDECEWGFQIAYQPRASREEGTPFDADGIAYIHCADPCMWFGNLFDSLHHCGTNVCFTPYIRLCGTPFRSSDVENFYYHAPKDATKIDCSSGRLGIGQGYDTRFLTMTGRICSGLGPPCFFEVGYGVEPRSTVLAPGAEGGFGSNNWENGDVGERIPNPLRELNWADEDLDVEAELNSRWVWVLW